MEYTRKELEALAFPEAPPLDPQFLAYEAQQARKAEPGLGDTLEERRIAYAQKCRNVFHTMTVEGARDHYLSQGVAKTWFTVKSKLRDFDIPVMQLDLAQHQDLEPEVVIIYIHGGGLAVGEADSEELTCRRMLKVKGIGRTRLYSVGYRLKDPYPAAVCISDCTDCLHELFPTTGRIILVGSSSGGQIAAQLSLDNYQSLKGRLSGVMLRGPVTADAHSGMNFIPERFREFHTSNDDSFLNSMSFYLKRRIPQDGLLSLPLQSADDKLAGQPKTWIQISTNDPLYSDGLCYAMALQEQGVEVRLDVIYGWPHTFWLVAPELPRSLKAEDDMIEGLRWLVS